MSEEKAYVLALIDRELGQARDNLARAELQLRRCRPEFKRDTEFLVESYKRQEQQAVAARRFVERHDAGECGP